MYDDGGNHFFVCCILVQGDGCDSKKRKSIVYKLNIRKQDLSIEVNDVYGESHALIEEKDIDCCLFAEFLGMDVRPFTFSYAELKMATNDFDPANKLGEGGFGPVYKVHGGFN